ncbi:RidA family protein [Ruania zhangjianzhongii]|uniref:RidA family protein n=1 Tax=Ruania zhangjianzhongii TaxID=2603206 RepID=UPI0011C9888B|nr:RidA family protein [Ruania zhangjianzhongii]
MGGAVKENNRTTIHYLAAGTLGLTLVGCSGGSGDASSPGDYAQTSENGVSVLTPDGAIDPTGTWNVGTRSGDYVHVAGMRGIDPDTNELVDGDLERVRQGFLNMQTIAESEGATLQDAVRLVVYVTDMDEHRPLVNEVQEELWGEAMYPPRSIIEVTALNDDDIFEVEGTFYAPVEDD